MPRWKTKVGDYYQKLSATGGVVVAEGRTGEVHALDARTGDVLWKRKAENESHTLDGAVYLSNPIRPWLTAVDASSGETRWRGDFSAVVNMAVAGSVVCFGYEGPTTAVGVRDGRTRWSADVPPELGLAADSRVVVAAGPRSLVGLDPRGGRERWTSALRLRHAPPLAAFLVGAGLVFIGADDGVLHAVRADDGSPVWRKGHAQRWFNGSSLKLSGGVLYADSGYGTVVAMDAATGAERWSRPVGEGGHDLALSGGTLFAASTRTRTVLALDTADGRVRWSHRARVGTWSGPDGTDGVVGAGGLVFLSTREGDVEAVGGGAGAGS
ncbi:PQQ-binding-like beta-propeller repeat protein [Actinomadura sp. CNU-125]|uniref:outer membrane protein assembly factor BamB family protein n=1 Tax=Actinomadura sp. CNU-125 TaxID=1904961 RepID=UPI0009FADC88|nr:PQQ-binding-like beta-propeller repeat protein [Actinomadura sp. CNU-125]